LLVELETSRSGQVNNVLLGLSGRQSEKSDNWSLNRRLLTLLKLMEELLLSLQLPLHRLDGWIHGRLNS
jgi:hypothetical protein